jgi:hypothetical protein
MLTNEARAGNLWNQAEQGNISPHEQDQSYIKVKIINDVSDHMI